MGFNGIGIGGIKAFAQGAAEGYAKLRIFNQQMVKIGAVKPPQVGWCGSVGGNRAGFAGQQNSFPKEIAINKTTRQFTRSAGRFGHGFDGAGVNNIHGFAGVALFENDFAGRDMAQQEQPGHVVERLYRDARLYPIGGGTREIMNEIIAKAEAY